MGVGGYDGIVNPSQFYKMMVWVLVAVLLLLGAGAAAGVASRRRRFSLDGKVVVITGAASGIGRRLALKVFGEAKGVTLALLDVDLEALRKLRTELLQLRENESKVAFVYECDVSDCRAVDECIARVVADVAPRHLGVLVNNAGR